MHMAEQKDLSNPALRGRLLVDEPMRKHLTWRTGGAADHPYVPADLDDAAQFLRSLSATEPIYFIGLGSNVLVRDGGIRGTVMLMHSSHAAVHMDGALVYAEARAASPKAARYAATHGYVGAEFLAGIPGSVGGALAMNGGACVPQKHANFRVNAEGRGSSADIQIVIAHVRHAVLPKHGVELMTEVRI